MIVGLISLEVIPMCSAPESNWRAWWPSRADEIAADARRRLAAAVDGWRLRDLEPMLGGEVALVFAVAAPDGDAVLKVNPRVAGATDELAQEGHALELWAGQGIGPRVLGARDDGLTLLLQRIRPGHNLRDTGADARQIMRTLGGLCPRIHLVAEPGRFCPLGEGSEATSWRHALAGTRELAELERLLTPSREDRLLHTDLHWLNALRGPRGWTVIDPKPHVGDPHADVFAFFDGPPLSAMPDGRRAAREHMRSLTELYARTAGLDRDRVEAWIRIRALAIAGESDGCDGSDGSDGQAESHPGRAWHEQLLRLADAVV